MEQISKVRRCYHCGAILQSDNPNEEGYVTKKEVIDNSNYSFLFCDKCFEIERYRSTSNEPMIDEDFKKIMIEAKQNNCLVVYVINLFTFETNFSKDVVELLKNMKIMVVGMKFDLLPVGTNADKIAEYVAHRFRVAGIKVTSDDVSIVKKQNEETLKEVLTKIFELKDGKNVYVIGSNSAGKTSLIQGFLKIYSNLSNGNITTRFYPNTNLRVMEIPLTSKSAMYETPGISITNSILFGLDNKTLKTIELNKNVEGRKITIANKHSLFIGGLAIVELVKGPQTDITCFFHEKVQLRKNHVRNTEKKFISLNKKKELIPSLDKIKTINDLEVFDVEMQDGDGRYRDIGFSGLGWVTMKSMNQKLRIYLPKGVSLYTSRPKIEIK